MISVIVPSFNSALTIEATLKALARQTKASLIKEIIVVDSSTDKKTKMILSQRKADKLKVLNGGIKIMPARSRNIGAAEAKGKVLAFIDADAYPDEIWLEEIFEAYQSGCRAGGGGIDVNKEQINNPIALAQFYLQFNEYINTGERRIKSFVPACNLFCERQLFQKAGGFPEIRAAEDVLFGLEINKRSPLWFLPEAKVYHIFREKWGAFIRNQMLLGKYVSIYRQKHYGRFIYKGIIPLIFFPAFLLVKLSRIFVRIGKAGWVHIFRFIKVAPIFLSGLFFWSIGFINGCTTSNENFKY